MYAGVPSMAPVCVSFTDKYVSVVAARRRAVPLRRSIVASGSTPESVEASPRSPSRSSFWRAAFASSAASVTWRARPKSMTRTGPSLVTMTFSGLKSRCTSPAACAAARPLPAARYTSRICRRVRAPACTHAPTVMPSTNSIARKTLSPNVPTS